MSDNGTIKYIIENIGGIYGRQEFEFKPGLNLVSAPNGFGKSSFVYGFQALAAESRDLRRMSHVLHSFEGRGRAELLMPDGSRYVRHLRASKKGTISVGGKPVHSEGRKVSIFCIAHESNELMDMIRNRRPLKDFLLGFSDRKYYLLLAEYCKTRHKESLEEIRGYREQIAALADLRCRLKAAHMTLETLEHEKSLLPAISLECMFGNEEDAVKYDRIKSEHDALVDKNNSLEGEQERLENSIEFYKYRRERLLAELTRFEEEHPDCDRELEEMKDRQGQLKEELKELLEDMGRLQARLEDTDRSINRHIEFGFNECFACGQPTDVERLRQRRVDIEADKKVLSEKMVNCEKNIKELDKSIEDFSREIKLNQVVRRNEIHNLDHLIETSENRLKTATRLLEEKRPELSNLEEKVRLLESSFDKETLGIIEKHRALERKMSHVRQKIEIIKSRIADIGVADAKFALLEKRVSFFEQIAHYVFLQAEKAQSAIREIFNQRTGEVLGLLEIDQIERIYMDEDFDLKVIRTFQGRKKAVSIDILSRSELEAIALLLMLAGREVYVPDFPFFVADEGAFSDPARFCRLMKYISRQVPYTVATHLVPKEKQSALLVEHPL